MFTIVDEYSCFVWAFPCKDTSIGTVVKIYNVLVATYGAPGTIHSDRGSGFLSSNMRYYLNEIGIKI